MNETKSKNGLKFENGPKLKIDQNSKIGTKFKKMDWNIKNCKTALKPEKLIKI